MSAVVLPFELPGLRAPRIGDLRVNGGITLRIGCRQGRSFVADVRERDGYKMRFPRGYRDLEAVIINTGGGIAGGDRITQSISIEAGAAAAVATQSAERIYRALDDKVTHIGVTLGVAAGAKLSWLPQETILFDGVSVERSICADVAVGGSLVLAETTVFGRAAMGESITSGRFRDSWRIRYGGMLVLAENVRIEGDIAGQLKSAAIGSGGYVVSTVVLVAQSAMDALGPVRDALTNAPCQAAASAWGHLLVVRMLGQSSESVRLTLAGMLPLLTKTPVPRVWSS